ncbi:MAG TPA: tellurite resistance/C4-dicarboxylate transporter family protein [Vicinamibacteria bacterium]|nr:tellurite resistance/C4-dicarboxylate transporter family protein [Vicinamibacteria bacterium]
MNLSHGRAAATGSPLLQSLDRAVAELHPAYFALVMATGILSVACRLLGIGGLPPALTAIAVTGYLALWGLTLWRIVRHRAAFLADFRSHQRGPGFFTMVAATSVIGTDLAIGRGAYALAHALWWVAFSLWLLLTYAIFTCLTVKETKPSLEDGINGGWLTAVVATQSLVVLGSAAIPRAGEQAELIALGLVSLWLAGGMLYIWMISLIFYRYTFLRFRPSDLMPPYWINMGAMAISTLGGALLVQVADSSSLLTSLLPFLKGFTLLYWATATWWIPMLVVLGLWRYVSRKVPLTYDPQYWGAVFPLAMYTSATYRLAEALPAPFLLPIPRFFVGAALTAWLMTFLGLLVSLVRALRQGLRWGRFRLPAPAVQPELARRET